MSATAVIVLRPGAFLAVIGAAALAATFAALASGRGFVVPIVVVELLAGVVIGPHGFGFHSDRFLSFFADLGLALFFFALVLLAFHLGLDLLLGGFAAGIIARHALGAWEAQAFDSKLTAIAFGVFVPFFFIISGMKLDLPALFATAGGVAKMVLFFVLFLVVRGVPALVLYRNVLGRRDRAALALMSSTQLPLVLAITALATSDGHMRASTAAALVGGAVLST